MCTFRLYDLFYSKPEESEKESEKMDVDEESRDVDDNSVMSESVAESMKNEEDKDR